ncbi:MAG: hypothetical protein D6701_15550 [Gemmatimonadetes bacterium]|nr:MAG: hypothetical protein D6701_15550 [Gemmatimonadota bacterium]
MSNSRLECREFLDGVEGPWSAQVRDEVVVVNCARGGHAIEKWIDPAFDADLWDRCRDVLIPAAGLRPDQVRVVYHKAANQFTTSGGSVKPPYPDPGSDYHAFIANLDRFAERVVDAFPSLQAVYTSSRIYGGFTTNAGRGEPLSYEEGHALNTWLADHPAVRGVWFGWGPYLWAPACETGGTNGSGRCWELDDYQADRVHPSAAGQQKAALMIHERFLREAWYRR